jgi:uncharacterized membrane protein
MMLHLETYSLIKWLHLLAVALGGGAAMMILLLAGFEDSREDLRGLTAVLWRRTAAWAFRLAVVLGVVLLVLRFASGDQPFEARYLHWKLVLVVLLLVCSELSPRTLGRARRGSAMLAFLFFLMATFVSVNKDAFGTLHRPGQGAAGHYSGAVQAGGD